MLVEVGWELVVDSVTSVTVVASVVVAVWSEAVSEVTVLALAGWSVRDGFAGLQPRWKAQHTWNHGASTVREILRGMSESDTKAAKSDVSGDGRTSKGYGKADILCQRESPEIHE